MSAFGIFALLARAYTERPLPAHSGQARIDDLGPKETFVSSAANVRKEPNLQDFRKAVNVRFASIEIGRRQNAFLPCN